MSDVEHKEITMYQGHPYKFQTNTYAPITETDRLTGKKTCGKARFTVEVMVYVGGSIGWDIVDPFTSGNELLVGFRDFIRLHEFLGYQHLGLSADELTNKIKNMWDEK